jgi:hypothetical protein
MTCCESAINQVVADQYQRVTSEMPTSWSDENKLIATMEESSNSLDQIITHAEDYLKTRQQLTQHIISEKVVVLTSTLVTSFVLFTVFVLAAFFASFGLAAWITRQANDPMLGYGLVGGGYLIIGLLMMIFRKSILKTPIMNAMVKNIYNENNNG